MQCLISCSAGSLLMPQPKRWWASRTTCTGPATSLVEGFGGTLLSYYFSFGEYDGVGIAEFPDNKAAAACSMAAAATGGFARFETTTLLTAKEAEAAMQHAHDAKNRIQAATRLRRQAAIQQSVGSPPIEFGRFRPQRECARHRLTAPLAVRSASHTT